LPLLPTTQGFGSGNISFLFLRSFKSEVTSSSSSLELQAHIDGAGIA
jgi:hypothetical protein